MKLDNQSFQGIVVALKANYLIVEINFDELTDISQKFKSSNTIRLLCTKRNRLSYYGFSVSVGDNVLVDSIDWTELRGVITNVKPRKIFISRPPVANFSDLFVVFSCNEPSFDSNQLTRFLVSAEDISKNITIILTKSDLIPKDLLNRYSDRLQKWGYNSISVSILTGEGINNLKEKLKFIKLGVLCGPSGVGKTSLLNYLIPEVSLPISNLSKKLKRGRHTTRHVELFRIYDTIFLADTPGFNQPFLSLEPYKLSKLFPELRDQLDKRNCKFRDCLHLHEPGCIVSKNWERYPIYTKILQEMVNLR
ncbi:MULTISPECIES: ribosome small subunit-dependent GTPase A [unclassified Prochlorococcus]|uniref:ribosome small subunit-dependent GTPase A n=1 Tax=unclassified Prochlorococcus TaxID=2627481 RepID=UPI00053376A1|nr:MULTISPECIES: ribosome small subunit-dependent GTPase A [unclassified Prochlorococcus]KGG16930.1 Ribosome small subunit-stimulated GTPase EngC [Prochlorococcus sp. MIT 0602]KGG18094.1 Ribosome small subunit-stimulated GTPase EngC [Prochlorococcus sp. MIT 0603]